MIRLEKLHVRAGDFCLSDISLEIPKGQYGVLMGKTGSGKTTVLEAICGLKEVLSGKVFFDGCDVTHARAGARGIGFVPQDTTLFSTMTVQGHLSFGPSIQRWSRKEIAERVEELADCLGIRSLLKRKPYGLSGGERQRVSLGRALAVRPQILCLDEPLSALDEDTQGEMRDLIRRMVRENDITTLHITHSRAEAEEMADCIFRLEDGSLKQ